jgi:hypothetical protein
MTQIFSNLAMTGRMLSKLESDKNFGVDNIANIEPTIPMISWMLWGRAKDSSGEVRIVQGPRYEYTSIKIRDALQVQRARFFQIPGGIICATFSKDLEYDEAKKYKADINKGEIYVYPAFIDSMGFPFPK